MEWQELNEQTQHVRALSSLAGRADGSADSIFSSIIGAGMLFLNVSSYVYRGMVHRYAVRK